MRLIQLFILLVILHILTLLFFRGEWGLTLTTKLLPMFVLIYLVGKNFGNLEKGQRLFLFGLLFSTLGDAILSEPFTLFIAGLISFLIAHLFYIFAFSRSSSLYLIRSIPFYLLGGVLGYFLFPLIAPEMKIPVFIYGLALTTMGWRIASRNTDSKSLWIGISGAILFIISDSIIGFSQLGKIEIPNSTVLIMITYYSAQYLLFQSFSLGKGNGDMHDIIQ
jgi:uncharacterized membrane protein YhhN